MVTVEKIKYNGRYPNLCSGHLKVTLSDGRIFDFPSYCMISGGACYWDSQNKEEIYEEGPWRIGEYPADFPDELKQPLLDKINEEVRFGCCGGCM